MIEILGAGVVTGPYGPHLSRNDRYWVRQISLDFYKPICYNTHNLAGFVYR